MTESNQNSSIPATVAKPFAASIDPKLFLDCVHCGLCTSACPTYLELGTEMDSPRGRIYLMRAIQEGRADLTPEAERHLDLCLDCRACETACPSGVQYGRLIEPFRAAMEEQRALATPMAASQPETAARAWWPNTKSRWNWFRDLILFGIFPYPRRLRWSLVPARLLQRLGLDKAMQRLGLLKVLPTPIRTLQEMLPPWRPGLPPLPARLPALGKQRARVWLWTGCVADAIGRATHWATARVLQHNGCEVLVPSQQMCCGAIHYHAGATEPAVRRAIHHAQLWQHLQTQDPVDAVVLNVAGCGSMLKELTHLPIPAPQAKLVADFSQKVVDVSEFLWQLGPVPPTGPIPITAVYHDACHLAHAQKITQPPRQLLQLIPQLQLLHLPESEICCGAAGSYNLTEPEMAQRLGLRKLQNVHAQQPQALLIGNIGCLLHLGRLQRLFINAKSAADQQPLWLAHPIELLDRSYRQLGIPDPRDMI